MIRLKRLGSSVVALIGLASAGSARAGLDEYVSKADSAFAWKQEENHTTPAGKVIRIKLTSQVWQGITWEHRLEIFEPLEIKYEDAMLLFITGGSQTSQPSPEDTLQGFLLAKLCGARCAVLHQVPNQPLLGGKKEDDLIAETFEKYLATGDENWPLLFPMVKSAVKAMDAAQEWAKKSGRPEVKRFVVSGGSKRGWTTWLTASVDKRVAAIAPMVIVMLNMRKQNPHQLEVWGKYSEQIGDYTRRGLTEKLETEQGLKLWQMVDPYTYRDRLTMPKLLVNGTNDRYWTLDAMNLYWDDLKGPKYVIYVPNAGHGLEKNRDYATEGLGAFFRNEISGRGMPKLEWKHSDEGNKLRLTVHASPPPLEAHLWVARSNTKDFRESPWTSRPLLKEGSALVGEVPRPEQGDIAIFGDLEYEVDGIRYHLSTQVRQEGPKAGK